ncbi:MAG: 3-keto-5-aminohexanoate cleavage protein [Acidimicrobiia bacterium]
MSLVDAGRIAIEVGLNESTTRAQNPHVAYGPEEVAADAVACAQAGAALGHFHSRLDDGTQAWSDADLYRRGMELTAKLSDIVLYPSYLGDHSHIWELCNEPPDGAPLPMASFDVAQEITSSVLWNEATGRFEDPPFEVVGEVRRPDALVERFRSLGLCVTVGAFDVGQLRWAVLAIRSGFLPTPCHLKIFLFDQLVTGPFADERGLDAYLSQVPDGLDVELTVVPYTMTSPERTEALLRAALARGCNIRVGIGDNPGAYPSARNAELVARAVELVQEAGYEPATPTEVRTRLQLPGAER